jgi:hypothetical protein
MTTTFTSRELVRDALVALFVANGSWSIGGVDNVYGYSPGYTVISGRSPVLTILSGGTRQQFQAAFTNKASYRFEITNYVVSGSESDATVVSSTAQDEGDTLDKTIRQIIRDNASGATYDNLRFDDNFSNVERGAIGNKPYVRETYIVIADLSAGS